MELMRPNSSFIIQLAGGLLTVSDNIHTESNGLHIYTAGVALQEFFIFVFIFLVFSFQRRLAKEATVEQRASAKKLLFILYTSLGLISVCPFEHFVFFSFTDADSSEFSSASSNSPPAQARS